jgi:hypothetical protein
VCGAGPRRYRPPLADAGADTTILDDKFQADALGWAEYCKRPAVAKLIRAHGAARGGNQ